MAASMKMAVFWVVEPCSLVTALMTEAVSTSETSGNFYQTTQCNNPEDSHIHMVKEPHTSILDIASQKYET
jgi:hypothetical protein